MHIISCAASVVRTDSLLYPFCALGKWLLCLCSFPEHSALGKQAGVSSWSASSLAPTISSTQCLCSLSFLFSLTFSLALFRLQQQLSVVFSCIQPLLCFLLFPSWTVLFRLLFICLCLVSVLVLCACVGLITTTLHYLFCAFFQRSSSAPAAPGTSVNGLAPNCYNNKL